MTPPPISIRGLGKVFVHRRQKRVAGVSTHALGELRPLLRHVLGRDAAARKPFRALHDVSFDVAAGETMGVIGRNGAGKTTLLKVLARVLEPSAGTIELRGRVASLLELGTGFSGDLTVEENVRIHLALAGQRGNRDLEQEIIALADLEAYRDVELDDCPGGALNALSFAVLISVSSDIVLADEMLAVGSARFKQVSLDRIRRIRDEGGSILFVSHDLEAIRSICDRAIWIEGGQVRRIGPVDEVVDAYEEALSPTARNRALARGAPCAILDLHLLGPGGTRVGALAEGEPARFEAFIRHADPGRPVTLTLEIRRGRKRLIVADTREEALAGREPRTVRVSLTLPRRLFAPRSDYEARLVARWEGTGETATERRLSFSVIATELARPGGLGLTALRLPWRTRFIGWDDPALPALDAPATADETA